MMNTIFKSYDEFVCHQMMIEITKEMERKTMIVYAKRLPRKLKKKLSKDYFLTIV